MLDVETVVYKYFEDVIVQGDDLMVDCPFCEQRIGKADVKHHLGVSLAKQAVHCFRCEYSGSWIKFVMDFLGVNYAMALGELYVKPRMVDFQALEHGPIYRKERMVTQVENPAELPPDFTILKGKTTPMKRAGISYLQKRGFDQSHIDFYQLGIAETSQPWRIIIPIEAGYWQARRILDYMEPKYVNPKNPSKAIIFNSQALENYDEVVICEGAFSSMAIGYNSIALISKEPTQERIERILATKVPKFIVALEPGAYGSMGKLMQALYRNGREVVVWNYSTGDPADPAGKFTELSYSWGNRVILGLN